MGRGMECGTVRDGERGRAWAVAWYVELLCDVEWGSVCAVAWNVELLCDVEWGSVCAVAWNVERCVMGNEVERGLWHGMWNGARWGMR